MRFVQCDSYQGTHLCVPSVHKINAPSGAGFPWSDLHHALLSYKNMRCFFTILLLGLVSTAQSNAPLQTPAPAAAPAASDNAAKARALLDLAIQTLGGEQPRFLR